MFSMRGLNLFRGCMRFSILILHFLIFGFSVLDYGLWIMEICLRQKISKVICPIFQHRVLIPVPPSPGSRLSSSNVQPCTCDGQCGRFIGFKVLPWTTAPAIRWRVSPTKPDQVMWKIELIPNEMKSEPAKLIDQETPFEYYWTKPRCFDAVRVSVTLEAIRYEYTLRKEVENARKEHPEELCVCDYLVFPTEHEQEFWPSESGYGYGSA